MCRDFRSVFLFLFFQFLIAYRCSFILALKTILDEKFNSFMFSYVLVLRMTCFLFYLLGFLPGK